MKTQLHALYLTIHHIGHVQLYHKLKNGEDHLLSLYSCFVSDEETVIDHADVQVKCERKSDTMPRCVTIWIIDTISIYNFQSCSDSSSELCSDNVNTQPGSSFESHKTNPNSSFLVYLIIHYSYFEDDEAIPVYSNDAPSYLSWR